VAAADRPTIEQGAEQAIDMGTDAPAQDAALADVESPGPDGPRADHPVSPFSMAEVAAACDAWAAARCGEIETCAAPRHLVLTYVGQEQCRALFGRECQAELAPPGVSDTPARRLACADAIARRGCPAFFDEQAPEPCRPLDGTGGLGAPCRGGGRQCEPSLACRSLGGGCATCVRRTAVGGMCWGDECEVGSYCQDAIYGPGKCVLRPVHCDDRTRCPRSEWCREGQCVTAPRPRGKLGEVCGLVGSPQCDERRGLLCLGGTCAEDTRPVVTEAGQPCGGDGGGAACAAGLVCEVTNVPVLRCYRTYREGESCTPFQGAPAGPCLPPAVCTQGRCQVPEVVVCR
jgi:hypothetical protein